MLHHGVSFFNCLFCFRWEEFLNKVNNISVLVEQLQTELDELVQDQNTPAMVSCENSNSLVESCI